MKDLILVFLVFARDPERARPQTWNYLEETEDVATFRQKLLEMMEEPPADEAVEKARNVSFFGRLMGMVKSGV